MSEHADVLQLVSRVEDMVFPSLLFKTKYIFHQVFMDLDLDIAAWKFRIRYDLPVL